MFLKKHVVISRAYLTYVNLDNTVGNEVFMLLKRV